MKNEFMIMAFDEAKKAGNNNEVPIGAVIVKDNKVISKAHNTKELNECVICHAEMIAIKRASSALNNWRLDGCDIYITLEPCPMCASAIKQARINRIFFGLRNSDKKNIKIVKQILLSDRTNKNVDLFGGYYQSKIYNLMKFFFLCKRKK